MNTEEAMTLEYAQGMANHLVNLLEPATNRIEIAGSIRRKKPYCSDIEIVCEPHIRVTELPGIVTITDEVNLLEVELQSMLRDGTLEKRPDKNGNYAWGERAKRAVVYDGKNYAPADIFVVQPPAQFGVIYAIRTGPWRFNRLLVLDKRLGGACPEDLKISGGLVWYLPENDYSYSMMASTKFLKVAYDVARTRPVESEEHFFDILGVPYWPPEERTVQRLKEFLKCSG